MTWPFLIDERELLMWALNIGKAAIIFIIGILIGRFMRIWLLKLGSRRSMNLNAIALLGNLIQIASVVFSIVLILPTFGVDWTALLTLIGTVGLAVSLAAQDLIRNFIAGIYILIEQPFKIGDKVRVETGTAVTGTVQSIELRVTNLRTDNGEQIIVPNNLIFSNVLTNLSALNVQRHSLTITVPNTSLTDVSSTIRDTLKEIADVCASPAPSTTVESLTSNQLKLKVNFWTPNADPQVLPRVMLALGGGLPGAEITMNS